MTRPPIVECAYYSVFGLSSKLENRVDRLFPAEPDCQQHSRDGEQHPRRKITEIADHGG